LFFQLLKLKLKVHDFQNLLGAEGFNVPPKDKYPQTLDDLKDKDDLANEQIPIKLRYGELPHLMKAFHMTVFKIFGYFLWYPVVF